MKLDSDYENVRRRIDTSSAPAPTTGLAYHYEVDTWDNAYTSCDINNRILAFDGTAFMYYPPDFANSGCFASCDDDPYCNFASITDMQELRDVTSVSDNEGVFCSDYGSARCLLNLQYDDSEFSSNDYCAVCGGGVQYMCSLYQDCQTTRTASYENHMYEKQYANGETFTYETVYTNSYTTCANGATIGSTWDAADDEACLAI